MRPPTVTGRRVGEAAAGNDGLMGRSSGRRRGAAAAAIVTFGAAVAGAAWRAVRRPSASSDGAPPAAAPATWTCACGQELRSSGAGRHRVFWAAGAPDSEPILGDRCPSCDRPLPAEDAAAPARA
jgi:hypothetical protein